MRLFTCPWWNVNSTANDCECHLCAGCHVIYDCGPSFFGLLLAGLRHESNQNILHRTCALTTKSQVFVFSGNWHYGYAEWPVFRGMKTLLGKCFLFCFVWWLHFEVSVLQKNLFHKYALSLTRRLYSRYRSATIGLVSGCLLAINWSLSAAAVNKVLDLKVSCHRLVAIHKVPHL
jgi:hypothetical protein